MVIQPTTTKIKMQALEHIHKLPIASSRIFTVEYSINFYQGPNSFGIRHSDITMSNTCVSSVQSMRVATLQRFNGKSPIVVLVVPNNPGTMSTFSERVEHSNDLFAESALHGRQSQKLGNYSDALAYYQRALSYKKNSIHFETVAAQVEYASILFNTGLIYMEHYKQYMICSELFEQCLELRKCCLGSNHVDVLATMYCLAHANLTSGDDYDYSFTLLNESLSILLNDYPDNTSSIILVWEELARAQFALGDIDDAESSLKEISKVKAQSSPFL